MKKRTLSNLILTALGACTLLATPVSDVMAETLKIYWGNNDGIISRANPDGSGVESLYSTPMNEVAMGIDIDNINEKLYFADFDKIVRLDLSIGSPNPEVIINTPAVMDVAVDVENSLIYYGTYYGEIRVVNFDKTGDALILDLATTITSNNLSSQNIIAPQITGIDVDLKNGKIYWAEQTNGTIGRANLDGSGFEIVAENLDTGKSFGVAIDQLNDKLYYTTSDSNQTGFIRNANLDGSSVSTLVNAQYPYHIDLDSEDGKIYFSDFNTNQIFKANLDGSENASLVFSDSFATAIAVHINPDSDGDGTPDTEDLCDDDANKVTPQICGCGTPDTDANQNGLVDCVVQDPPLAQSVEVAEALAASTYRSGVSPDLLTTYKALVASISQSGFQGLEDELRRLRSAITRLKFLKENKMNKRQFDRILAKANAALAEIQAALRNVG